MEKSDKIEGEGQKGVSQANGSEPQQAKLKPEGDQKRDNQKQVRSSPDRKKKKKKDKKKKRKRDKESREDKKKNKTKRIRKRWSESRRSRGSYERDGRDRRRQLKNKYYRKVKEEKDPLAIWRRNYKTVHQDLDPSKPKLFWDGFQWITRMDNQTSVDPNLLSQTKKVRRVKIMNLPLYLGIFQNDIKFLIDQYMTAHYLKNPGNKNPILCVDINHSNNSVIVEFSSVEEANRVVKLESMELIGVKCKVARCSESMYGNQQNMVDKLKKIKVRDFLILGWRASNGSRHHRDE